MAPPASNRGHGKGAGVVIGPDIDEAGVAPDIVNAMGISLMTLLPFAWLRHSGIKNSVGLRTTELSP
jgi:hypothetical protein